MIFRRKEHKLPKFPPSVIPTFRRLCETLPVENVQSYREEVSAELERVRAAAKDNQLIDVGAAEELARCCLLLLEVYEQFDAGKRALIVGAIRYFALSEDSFSEETFASGFDDDIKVMNHVLEELEIDDQYIERK